MSLGLEVPFGPEKVEIVTAHSAPLYAPLDSTPEIPVVTHAPEPAPTETPNRNLKILGMEIPTDTNPLLVLAIAVLVAAAGRWGWKKRQAMKKGGNGG
ncbi:MAG: hypothetical protein OEM32_04535 [Acidimicrobiia bacterium]|nr:hypothetical protein [Acidimicrobiia bacterium]